MTALDLQDAYCEAALADQERHGGDVVVLQAWCSRKVGRQCADRLDCGAVRPGELHELNRGLGLAAAPDRGPSSMRVALLALQRAAGPSISTPVDAEICVPRYLAVVG
jgi:hypothetical protein